MCRSASNTTTNWDYRLCFSSIWLCHDSLAAAWQTCKSELAAKDIHILKMRERSKSSKEWGFWAIAISCNQAGNCSEFELYICIVILRSYPGLANCPILSSLLQPQSAHLCFGRMRWQRRTAELFGSLRGTHAKFHVKIRLGLWKYPIQISQWNLWKYMLRSLGVTSMLMHDVLRRITTAAGWRCSKDGSVAIKCDGMHLI